MRRAYIGVSSPIAYDYSYRFQVGPGYEADFHIETPYWAGYNAQPYPTPILESPYGLMLFYDEIWFLSRALCPPDMQELPYVHFISETEHAKNLYGKYVKRNSEAARKIIDNDNYFSIITDRTELINNIKLTIPISWEAQLSSRSEMFFISEMPCIGYAGMLETLLQDLVFLSHLEIDGLELIANRFSLKILKELSFETQKRSNLASAIEPILLDNIPNYLFRTGCYHPSIEEAREDPFLNDFRKWLSSFPRTVSSAEVQEIASEARVKLTSIQNEIFIKYLSRKTHYSAIGESLLNAGVDLILPGVGTGLGVVKNAIKGRKVERLRWLGFMANQSKRISETN